MTHPTTDDAHEETPVTTHDDTRALTEMLTLARELGRPELDNVIIGEGNVSARGSDGTIWIKGSGSSLRDLRADQVARVRTTVIMEAIERDLKLTDDAVRGILDRSRENGVWPSVETFFHTLLYAITDAQFIGHTHPVAVCGVLCSQRAEDITRHLMPDVIVVCGRESVFVPYTDPGIPLAREIGRRVRGFCEKHGCAPNVIYLQNHGLIALGQSARQVQNVTAMAVKHARVLAMTYALGGPRFLDEGNADRIHTRPDEEIRRAQFV